MFATYNHERGNSLLGKCHDAQVELQTVVKDILAWEASEEESKVFSVYQRLNRHLPLEGRALGRLSEKELQDEAIYGAFHPEDALSCIKDASRTWRFVKAVSESLKELEGSFPGQDLHVLDAGCGPLAFLGIIAAHHSKRVKVTALEVNPRSVILARKTLDHFGLGDRVRVECTDARTYIPSKPYHLVISETFDSGMAEEKGGDILSQSIRFLVAGGRVVPETLSIKGALVSKNVFEVGCQGQWADNIDWKTALRASFVGEGTGFNPYIQCDINIPQNLAPGDYVLVLTTVLEFNSSIVALKLPALSPITFPRSVAKLRLKERFTGEGQIYFQFIAGDLAGGMHLTYPSQFTRA